jgi:hypothetical protein
MGRAKAAWVSLVSVLVATGCGAGAVKEPLAPTQAAAGTNAAARPASRPAAESGIWALPEVPRDSKPATPAAPGELKLDAWTKASKAKGLPPAPAACATFAKRAAGGQPAELRAALLEPDAAKRDAMLVALEKSEPSPGAIRVVRAELAPVECADVIADPFLSARPTVTGHAGHVLVGLSLAAKLARTAANVPQMKDASDKEKVKRFIQGPLRTWMVEQATAIEALSAPASELAGQGRAIVAVEAGMADLRLVDRIRSAPVPSSWDKELKAVYEAALDDALEPRKRRGRDAALVGLTDFAADGVLVEPRVERARALLAKLYGGRRIDALDALLVPAAAPGEAGAASPGASLLASGSRSWGVWLATLNVTSDPPSTSGRARFEMGRKYWRRVDFVEAAHALAKEPGDDARLVLALSLALARGPSGPQEMMAASSPAALGLQRTDALDALAAEGGKSAGMAAFDAAHLRSLSPPEGDAAGPYLTEVAARFRKAAALLEDGAQKKRAEERAADAEASAKAVGGRGGGS